MQTVRLALTGAGTTLMLALLAGCSSSDSYSDPYHGSGISTGASFYYGSPYPYYPYYGYDGPDYIVVAPPRPPYPGGELPVRPPGPDRPTTLPAERPDRPSTQPSTRPAPSASDRSRMPSAQPRMSSPSARPSIPSRSRGGGGRRGR